MTPLTDPHFIPDPDGPTPTYDALMRARCLDRHPAGRSLALAAALSTITRPRPWWRVWCDMVRTPSGQVVMAALVGVVAAIGWWML